MKKRIYKIAAIFLIISILLTLLPSCTVHKKSEKLKIIGTVFPQFDFARQIGKDLVDCEMLLAPGKDSHSYTGDDPSSVYRIINCDLFIYVGGESDSEWVEGIRNMIESSGSDHIPVFLSLAEVCDLVDENGAGIIQEDGDEGDEFDEHVWTSPDNAIKASQAICGAMCELDPANSETFRENLRNYTAKLKWLKKGFVSAAENADTNVLVFADRFPFRYLADELGLECYAAFNGCASQSEPSPTTISELCKIVSENGLKYIFYIETSNSRVPDTICNATGCSALLLHSCHTVTQKELDDGATYLSLMEQNLINLKKAIKNG